MRTVGERWVYVVGGRAAMADAAEQADRSARSDERSATMYLDDKLLRQQHQERVQSAELERLAMAAQRDAHKAHRTVRPAWREIVAAMLRRARPAARLPGA